jgi:hypothetical protein
MSAICPRPRFVFSKSHNAAAGSNAGWEHTSDLTPATNILAPVQVQVCDGRHNLIVTKEATVLGSGIPGFLRGERSMSGLRFMIKIQPRAA